MRRSLAVTLAVTLEFAMLASGCGNQSAETNDASTAQREAEPPGPVGSVPNKWAPPADCGGVGNLCWDCGPAGACQLIGGVCVPAPNGPPTNRNADTPYCIARVCMTYDQASCFCTGKAGAQYAVCKSPAAAAGLCAFEGASCASAQCCSGLVCLQDSSGSTCYQSCTSASDCSTGCCTDLKQTGQMECAPASACQNPCVKYGGACAQQSDCCSGWCLTINADGGGPFNCYPTCTGPADCDAGCCGPIIGLDASACTPCH
jgi:hypothetical protein